MYSNLLLTVTVAILVVVCHSVPQSIHPWVNFDEDDNAKVNFSAMSIVERWEFVEAGTKEIFKDSVKRLSAAVWGRSDSAMNISGTCMRDILKVISGIRSSKTWAYNFFDASAKMIDGMLGGSVANFGEYDQCLDTEARDDRRGKNHGKLLFRGKYCALDIKPPLPPKKSYYKLDEVIEELKNFSQRDTVIAETAKTAHMFYIVSMRIGICVPSGCEESDISQITDGVSEFLGTSVKVNRCEVKEENVYTPSIIAVLCAFSFFALLVLIGTLLELFFMYTDRKKKGLVVELLMCFSFITSFKKLVHVKDESGPLDCFNGLRFFSISWIILGHTYLNINLTLFHGLKKVIDYPKDFFFQTVINATVSVDTFFFMGGFLVCYLSVKLIRELKKPFNIGLYILHRLFRIFPIYAMTVAFMFLAPLIGSGPIWHDTIDTHVQACEKNWWENLIFINNFYHANDMCLPHSWYVACDFQLYLAALIILLPLFRWPKVGLSIAGMAVLASIIGNGLLTYILEHPPTMLYAHPDLDDRTKLWTSSYFKPYSHAGPYYLGMMVGYLLVVKPKLTFSLPVRTLGWAMATTCNLAVLYGVWNWNSGIDANLTETLLYSSFHRVAWSLGVAWVVINCASGQGGVVNYILTWKCWAVLSRLTYGAYLIHPIVQITTMGVFRAKLQPAHWFAIWMYFAYMCVTYGCAFIAAMLVEAPFISFEKVIFSRKLKELMPKSEENGKRSNSDDVNQENRHVTVINTQMEGLHNKVQRNIFPLDRGNGFLKNGCYSLDHGNWRSPNGRYPVGNSYTHSEGANKKTYDNESFVYKL